MTNRAWMRCLCLTLAALPIGAASRAADVRSPADFVRRATWSVPSVEEVRASTQDWLDSRELDEETRAQVDALWSSDQLAGGGDAMLDVVTTTLAMADPQVRTLADICAAPREGVRLPEVAWLAEDATAPLVRSNMQLLYGRWLVQQKLYDEAQQQLNSLKPADVVDPAALLFYQAVVQHRALDREQGLATIGQLLEKEDVLPKRYASVARLMQADLEGLKDESLDHIARRMEDIQRRLDLGRAGEKVREVEDGVIASLDKLIDEMEKQQQAAAAAARAGSQPGQQPMTPLPDSRPMELKAPGDVANKPVGNTDGWGELPPHERQEALQQIGKEFPAHYRDMIEQYFRKLANDGSEVPDKQVQDKEQMVLLTWTILTGVALLGAAPEFEASALDGRTASGRLIALDAEQAVLETEQGPITFAIESLAAIGRLDAPARPQRAATLHVELADESRLAAVEYVVTDGTASITLTGGQKLSIPTRAIRWVRFAPPAPGDDALARQWTNITQTSATGDLLVIRKAEALDFLEGIVRDLTATTCDFEIDGEVIGVNREKLAGLVYFHTATDDPGDTVARMQLRDGSQLSVATVTLDDVQLKLTVPSGAEWTVPLADVTRFDFSAGKIAYLSDLDPERAKYVPFLGFRKELPVLEQYFSYQRDRGFENRPLALDGVTYRKGLALQSRTVLSYRLPGKFRLFKAVVGIDGDVQATGDAVLSIKADGKPLWEGQLRGGEPPQELELELGGARRLEIVADYGREQDVGDRVNLCEARVTK